MLYNPDILLVDDSPDDRFLLRRAFFRAGILNPLHEVRSGQEALAYLKGEGVYSDRKKHPFPGILLLDLNMPGVDGFGVLEWIRAKLTVQGLLIVVLSRSDEIRQVNRAYSLGANSFLTKPGNESDLQEMIRTFREYWLLQSKLPKIQPADEK